MTTRKRKKAPPPRRAKAWGGRFTEETHTLVEAFTTSLPFDRRLAMHDIAGSIAHARMLATCGILERAEGEKIVAGLEQIREEIVQGSFRLDSSLEDIHMAIEHRLIEKIGEIGGKLHTARSRNDQVALDLRLYLREKIGKIQADLTDLRQALVEVAEAHLDVILPGYTHLQRAQPLLLAHHLLAYYEMFSRDAARLADCLVRVNVLPLGAGALAGTGLPIDPAYVASLLGFPAVTANSVDAVSDRDFVVEFLGDAALIMVHLSRLSEEIVLWSTAEFGFVELPDAFATGSSMMPQKKNPDVAELVRGKSGRVVGALVALLTLLKGLPLSYNRDLQEDKEPLFDAVETLRACLQVYPPLLRALIFHPERMRQAAAEGFLNATDVADYLTSKGMPFRQAHQVAGSLVRHCLEKKTTIEELPLTELKRFSPLFKKDIAGFLAPEVCVERRRFGAGTARENVENALAAAKRALGLA